MRLRTGIVLAAGILLCLASQNVFAQDKCPEGYVSFVNTKTYESVCLPADVDASVKNAEDSAQPSASENAQQAGAEATGESVPETGSNQNIEASVNAANPPEAAVQANPEPVAAQEPMDAPAEQNNVQPAESQQTYVTESMPETAAAEPNAVNMPETAAAEPNDDSTFVTDDVLNQKIHESIMAGGWVFEAGLGYSIVAAVDLKLLTGYHFSSKDEVAGFGLYLDVDLHPGAFPVFSMDCTIDPVFHVSTGHFQFSLAFGLGFFGVLNDDFDDSEDSLRSKEFGVRFELKPAMAFDWFMTEKAFWGFGLSVPLIILKESESRDSRVQPWFNMDFHIGYTI
ncbi:MAG: hypothetical protein IJM59_07660 [Proteobacteria bacterium]|nr:hypothetical protein [Pseudomonadota bacterium]